MASSSKQEEKKDDESDRLADKLHLQTNRYTFLIWTLFNHCYSGAKLFHLLAFFLSQPIS